MYKNIQSLKNLKRNVQITLLNFTKNKFAKINRNFDKKLNLKMEKKENEFKKVKNNFKDNEIQDENEFPLKHNIYLQILSCMKKLNINEDDQEKEMKEKINQIFKSHNINFEIEDDEIMNIVTNKNFITDSKSDTMNSTNRTNQLLDYLEKIINDELSEEEYAEESNNNFRFVRPPHNITELKSVLNEADEIYEQNKNDLFHTEEEYKTELKKNIVKQIPNYLTMECLAYPQTKSEIILLGVQRNSDTHSLFVSNVLQNYQPDLIAIHMEPDIPLFLNTLGNFDEDWKAYVKGETNYDFIVNPLPNSFHEVLLSVKKMEQIFDYNFAQNNNISTSPKLVFSNQLPISIRSASNKYADTHLTPFIYSFNSKIDNFCPIVVCDYPILQKIYDIVHCTQLSELKEILKKFITEMENKNYSFSYEEYANNIFLSGNLRRLDYTAEILRQACYSHKKIVLVMNYHYVDTLNQCWKNLNPKIQQLNTFYRKNNDDLTFVDFIEKLVIVDLMQGQFIKKHFIQYDRFPYPFRKHPQWITGWLNLYSILNHYYDHYQEIISKIPFNNEKYSLFLEQFNIGYDRNKNVDSEEEEKNLRDKLLKNINI